METYKKVLSIPDSNWLRKYLEAEGRKVSEFLSKLLLQK